MCRPSSTRWRSPFPFGFMPMHHTMRPLADDGKPGNDRFCLKKPQKYPDLPLHFVRCG
jgi:hypothetical protein